MPAPRSLPYEILDLVPRLAALAERARFARDRDRTELWAYCARCYYAPRGGP